jgi:hypothetical protein
MHTNPDSGTDLRLLLRSVADTIHPPVNGLVHGGLEHGRRLRRHALFARVTIAAAMVVAAGTGAIGMLPDSDGGPGIRTASEAAVARTVPLDPRNNAAILISLLPGSGEISDIGGGRDDGWPRLQPTNWSYLTYDDGNGAVQISVSYSRGWREGSAPRPISCADLDSSCRMRTLADGSRLLVADPGSQGYSPGHLGRIVHLARPDGSSVALEIGNQIEDMTDGSYGPVTRADLPLTTTQLVNIVRSPLWQDTVTAEMAAAGARLEPFQLHHPGAATPAPAGAATPTPAGAATPTPAGAATPTPAAGR